MGNEITLGIRLTADGKGLVGEVKLGREELERLGKTGKQAGEEAAKGIERIGKTAKSSAEEMNEAYKTLGIRSLKSLQDEIHKVNAAQKSIAGTAGVSSQEISRAASAAKAEIAKLNDEMKGVAHTSNSASQGLQSMAQRYIGIAALTAGVVGLTKALFEAGVTAQKLQSTLSFATGSASNAAQEYQFIRKSVNELGLDLNSASMSFAKLAAAAQGTKIQGQGVRDIFTAVSQASTVMGLSAEETNGALYAISQMISKGTVASEELRGQLGERLPGAFQIAARAMGVSTAELGKMLEQGQVISDEFLPRFAAELSKTFESSLPTATKTAQTEINRLSTAWTEFKREAADSAFMDVAIGAIKTLTEKVKGAASDIAAAKQAYKRAGEDLGAGLLQGIGVALSRSPDVLFSGMGKQMMAVSEARYRGTAAYGKDLLKSQTADFGDEGDLATLEAQGRLSRGLIGGIARPAAAYDNSLSKDDQEFLDKIKTKEEVSRDKRKRLYALLEQDKITIDEYNKRSKQMMDELAKGSATKSAKDKLPALLDELTGGVSGTYRAKLDELYQGYAKGKVGVGQYRAAVEKLIYTETTIGKSATAAKIEVDKLQADGVKRLAEEGEKRIKALNDSVEADQKSLDALTLKNDLLEMGIESVTAMAVAELEAKLASVDYTEATYDEIAALEKRLDIARQINQQAGRGENIKAAKDAAKQMVADWKKSVEQYDDVFRKGFADMVNGGTATWKSFTKSLATTFKTTVADQIYKMFAQPFVVKIVASLLGITGGSALSAADASAAGGGGNLLSSASDAYRLFNGGMSVMGDYALGSLGIGSGLSQGAMLAAQTAEFGLAGATATAEALGGATGAMSGLTTALSAIPVWGGAALAALAVFSMSSKGGGPKTEGNAFGTIGASGALDVIRSADYAAPYGDGNWGRPGADAARVETLLAPVGQSIAKYIRKLGGSATGLGLTLGYNTDPNGTAPDNVSAGVRTASGEWAYRAVYDTERGKASEAMQGELAKMTLAAVQASDGLSVGMLEIANSVNVTTASVAEATAVLTKISNLQAVNDLLGTLAMKLYDTSAAGADMASALAGMFGGIQQMTAATQTYYANFFSDAERHAAEVSQLTGQFAALGQVIPDTRAGYRSLIEAQDLSTESGRQMFAALMSLNGAFAAVIPAAENAAAAIAEAASAALESATKSASDAMIGVTRAVSAEKDRLTAAYNAQIERFGAQIDTVSASVGKLQTLASSLKGTLSGMQIAGADASYRQAAQAQISAALAIARSGGGLPLDGQLDSALQAVSKPSEQLFASFADYASDFYKTANDIAALNELTGEQLSAEEAMQAILKAQLSAITGSHNAEMLRLDAIVTNAQKQLDAANGINISVLSVEAAVAALNAAISGLVAERAAQGLPTASVTGASSASSAAINESLANVSSYGAEHGGDAYYLMAGINDYAAKTESMAQLAAATGQSIADTWKIVSGASAEYWQQVQTAWDAGLHPTTTSIPMFATGGFHDGGYRIVGENGPELEATGPSRIFNAQQTRSMLQSGGANNDELVAEIKLLREDNTAMRAELRAIAGHTAKTSRLLDRAMPDGDALATRVAA